MKNIFAKNRQNNLHKYPGPPFQIRPGPGYFSRAGFWQNFFRLKTCPQGVLRAQ